jgi:hypothetical protein
MSFTDFFFSQARAPKTEVFAYIIFEERVRDELGKGLPGPMMPLVLSEPFELSSLDSIKLVKEKHTWTAMVSLQSIYDGLEDENINSLCANRVERSHQESQ